MKWRHWAILVVLVLLNYIVFSVAFTRMAAQRRPLHVTRTPQPTFTAIAVAGPIGWAVLPTNTSIPTPVRDTPTPVPVPSVDTAVAPTDEAVTADATDVVATEEPAATATAEPTIAPSPTQTPSVENVVHTVKRGEYLAQIASLYDVSMQAIIRANNITDPNLIMVGQKLVIPVSGAAPAPTSRPANTAPPSANPTRPPATATRRPATATPRPPTPTPKPAGAAFQFTGTVIWDPQVAPNCAGPAISRHSVVQDAAGNPVNGVRIEIDCYGNVWLSHPTGNPGEYDAGHYDFAFGQTSPQAWSCNARVYDLNGAPVTSSQVVTIVFDTNDCQPHGSGHQVAILNWVKNW